jgi:hypothetical protein
MFDKIRPRKEHIICLSFISGTIYLILSCAPAPTKSKVTPLVEEQPAQIESVNAVFGTPGKEAAIEIASSKPVAYRTFKLAQPLCVIVEMNALPVEGLTGPAVFEGKIIKAIHLEGIKDKPLSTRIIASLSQDLEYDVQDEDGTIKVLLSLKKEDEQMQEAVLTAKELEEDKQELRVKVLSGDGDLSSAREMAEKLTHMGYKIRLIHYAPRSNFSRNTVYFAAKFENEAERLVRSLGGNAISKPITWFSIFDLIVVTGRSP